MNTQNTNVIKAASFDSRTGDHSYSGWNFTTWYIVDGNVYYYNKGQGAFAGQNSSRKEGSLEEFASKKPDISWQDFEGGVDALPAEIQKLAGILVPIPDGCVLCIKRWSFGSQSDFDMEWCEVNEAGAMVAPALLKEGTLLREGETFAYTYQGIRAKSKRMIVTNNGGNAIDERDPEEIKQEKEAGKSFAREQISFLQTKGFSHEQAVRIMKAGGPGAVVPAWEWTQSVPSDRLSILRAALHGTKSWFQEAREMILDATEGMDLAGNALDMLLYGIGGRTKFGQDRQIRALQKLGLGTPDHRNSSSLFAALRAAKEMVEIPKGIIDPDRKETPATTRTGRDEGIPHQYRKFQTVTIGDLLKA